MALKSNHGSPSPGSLADQQLRLVCGALRVADDDHSRYAALEAWSDERAATTAASWNGRSPTSLITASPSTSRRRQWLQLPQQPPLSGGRSQRWPRTAWCMLGRRTCGRPDRAGPQRCAAMEQATSIADVQILANFVSWDSTSLRLSAVSCSLCQRRMTSAMSTLDTSL